MWHSVKMVTKPFNREQYEMECVYLHIRRYSGDGYIRKVRIKGDTIVFESFENNEWKKKRIPPQEIKRLVSELF